MSNPPPRPPRAAPPPPRAPAAAPPAFPTSSFKPQRSKPYVKIAAIVLIALGVVAAAFALIRRQQRIAAHDDAVETLMGQMQIEQQDSLPRDGWQGGTSIEGTNYMLMSFRDDNVYVKQFIKTLQTPTDVLVMFIDNRNNSDKHTVDLSAAKLHFAGNIVRDVPSQLQILQSASTNPAAAMEAFPQKIIIPPEKLLWGKLLFIPPGTDLRRLLAVTVTIDGKPVILEGEYFTAEQKRALSGGTP